LNPVALSWTRVKNGFTSGQPLLKHPKCIRGIIKTEILSQRNPQTGVNLVQEPGAVPDLKAQVDDLNIPNQLPIVTDPKETVMHFMSPKHRNPTFYTLLAIYLQAE